jgi:hypothetical protein
VPTPDRGAAEVFYSLPTNAQTVVLQWVALGHDLRDALLRSNALGPGDLVTVRDAMHAERCQRDRRELAEHESAHGVTAGALGLRVQHLRIADDHFDGECVHIGASPLENAIVLMAGELWIERFRHSEFPYGPHGLKEDHRALSEIGDVLILREAMGHCMEILKQNRAIVLATADKVEKYGYLVPW